MSIPFNKYVRIISGVGGGQGVRQRDLIARLFTPNVLVSPGVVLEFSSAANVAQYFGSDSEEAVRAALYFGYISPAIASPRAISFARFAEGGTAASVIGNDDPKSISQWAGATAGTLGVVVNGTQYTTTPVSLSGAASLAAVASALQTVIRAADASLSAATVSYGVVGPQRFVVTVPATLGNVSIVSVTTGANDAATIAGLNAASSAINITGVAAQTPVDAVNAAKEITNNYGSFAFLPALTLQQVESVAQANAAENVMFMYSQRVAAADTATWYAALSGYAGIGLTLQGPAGQYHDMIPMAIEAATDYSKRNSVQNYMYRQLGGMSPTVTDGGTSDALDALRINYYGSTSTAGQTINFYQRGTLMGTGTAPTDMNVYANEQWLKDYAGSQLMSLQLSVGRVPANESGRAMILNILQPVIEAALFNGVISVGKTLTPVQKVYIGQMTGSDLAWQTVQNLGYVLSCVIESYTTTSGATEYKAVYSLLYSKDDTVRLIEGTHSLI